MRKIQALAGIALMVAVSGCDQISTLKDKVTNLVGGGEEPVAPKLPVQQKKPVASVPAVQAQMGGGASGVIKVGDKTTNVVDYAVSINKAFGDSMGLKVYFFNAKLSDEQKLRLADKSMMTGSEVKEITGGPLPVMELWLLFGNNAKNCSADELSGLTVIFNKNQSFDFAVKDSGPINWSMSYSGDSKMREYGFGNFSCSFENGGKVAFDLKNHWLADGDVFKDMLSDGLKELDFSWDVSIKTGQAAVVSANAVAKPAPVAPAVETPGGKITLNNYTVESAAVSWIKETNLLKIIFFNKQMTDKQLAAAASNPPQFEGKDFVAGFYIEYAGKPEDFSQMPVSVVAEISDKGVFYSSDIDLDKIYVSGKPEEGSPIIFQSKGEFTQFGGTLKPALDWNFHINTQVNKVN